jgi:hypothetical protein
MPQKPQVRAKKKRRDTKRLERWRAAKQASETTAPAPKKKAAAPRPSQSGKA